MLRRPLLKQFGYRLFPGLCLCCNLPSGRDIDLCQGCEAALPAIGHRCQICALPLLHTAICGECLNKPPAFTNIIACYAYQSPVAELILALKNHRNLATGSMLGQLLADRIRATIPRQQYPNLIIPVPLHWRRSLVRGFNQSLELARPVGRELEIAVARNRVKRIQPITQQGRNKDARRRNLRQAFRVVGNVRGLRLAIVDDVVTTTGTTRAMAAVLMAAGASRVDIWCIARTPLEK
ncbi:MAG: hypothetical protein VR73_03595 [Gammaproteobacteria bacterium BRH_c0]|nr:MAG: hypothetical protein VR73_03595 [Gammaproteobacteria bacterium BRH_c0]